MGDHRPTVDSEALRQVERQDGHRARLQGRGFFPAGQPFGTGSEPALDESGKAATLFGRRRRENHPIARLAPGLDEPGEGSERIGAVGETRHRRRPEIERSRLFAARLESPLAFFRLCLAAYPTRLARPPNRLIMLPVQLAGISTRLAAPSTRPVEHPTQLAQLSARLRGLSFRLAEYPTQLARLSISLAQLDDQPPAQASRPFGRVEVEAIRRQRLEMASVARPARRRHGDPMPVGVGDLLEPGIAAFPDLGIENDRRVRKQLEYRRQPFVE